MCHRSFLSDGICNNKDNSDSDIDDDDDGPYTSALRQCDHRYHPLHLVFDGGYCNYCAGNYRCWSCDNTLCTKHTSCALFPCHQCKVVQYCSQCVSANPSKCPCSVCKKATVWCTLCFVRHCRAINNSHNKLVMHVAKVI